MTESAAVVTRDSPVPAVYAKPQARRVYQLYALLLLLIPLAFLAAAVPIVRSPSFPAESADPFLLHADYPFSLKHVDCEVVIFGDSTASTGVDPTVVQRTTGLKTCNIAQSQSILAIMGTAALDTYLANNVAPKYLLVQLAPESLARDREDFFWAEGLTLLVRTKPVLAAVPTFIRHPVQSYRFAMWALKAKLGALKGLARPDFSVTEESFRSRGGLLILPKPAQTRCTNTVPFRPPTRAWVRALRDKYARGDTRVLIDVSPMPDCAANAESVADGTRGITDNSPAVYPVGLFCDLDRHLTLAGAERWSTDLGRQILTLTQK
ncbi:MAG TPA: hypothetical protein VJQ47_13995 [Steroidobacteraceae bacterium]|nr:hypothetical protein [Steroidobacteraceae bacterium]